MDGETVFIMLMIIFVAVSVGTVSYTASYTAGQNSVKRHISVYGCEKTILVYDIDIKEKK